MADLYSDQFEIPLKEVKVLPYVQRVRELARASGSSPGELILSLEWALSKKSAILTDFSRKILTHRLPLKLMEDALGP